MITVIIGKRIKTINDSLMLITNNTPRIPAIDNNPHNKSTIPQEIISLNLRASDVRRAIIQPWAVLSK